MTGNQSLAGPEDDAGAAGQAYPAATGAHAPGWFSRLSHRDTRQDPATSRVSASLWTAVDGVAE